MDERQMSEMVVEVTEEPTFFQSEEGRTFFAGLGPIKSEKGPNKLAFITFGLGVALFGSFFFMINRDIDMPYLVFMITLLGGMFGVLLGGIWAFAEATTKPVIRTATHVVSGTVTKKKMLKKVGVWQIKADFQSPETQKMTRTTFVVPPKNHGGISVDHTRVAIVYSPKYDQGVVL